MSSDVKGRFAQANQKLRDENVGHLLKGAGADPNWRPPVEDTDLNQVGETSIAIASTRLSGQALADNQRAQMQQRKDILAKTQEQTVQHNDQASASGEPSFVQTDPNDPIPMPTNRPARPQTIAFGQPRTQRRTPVEGEVIVDKQEFMEPAYVSMGDVTNAGPGINTVKFRDPTEAAAAAAASHLLGFKKARVADAPRKIDPNEDYRPATQQVPEIQGEQHTLPETFEVGVYEPHGQDLRLSVIPDLNKAILDAVELLGESEAAAYFQTTVVVVRKWKEGKQTPNIRHLQILLADPEAQAIPEVKSTVECFTRTNVETGDYFYTGGKPKVPLMICMAIKGDMSPAVHHAHMFYQKRWDINYGQKADTLLVAARNQLVDWFLETTNEYMLMMDSDVLPPIGNASWFKDHTKWTNCRETAAEFDLIQRLLSHGKEIVGASYPGRSIGMAMINQPDLNPRPGTNDKEIAKAIRKQTARGLVECDWIPAGCMLVRRNVFESVKKRFPNLAPRGKDQHWNWFGHDNTAGEDVAFCLRARQSGHKIYLDTELTCGHIGRFCYTPGTAGPVELRSL